MTIEPYSHAQRDEWNELVRNSRNATFLLDRGYMDYHADRFPDRSLMLRDDHGRLVAALPATAQGTVLHSHRGLTYGGWIMDRRHSSMAVMLRAWEMMTQRLRDEGFTELIYKSIPYIYHRYPSDEDQYLIFRSGGHLIESNLSAAVNLHSPVAFDSNASRGAAYASRNGVIVAESRDFNGFWEILSQLLRDRYDTSPVHTAEEITLLASRFPDNIRLYTATCDGTIIAGAVMFMTDTVAHTQYIAASPEGKRLKALPLLFSWIMDNCCAGLDYFDFGTSNEDHGRYLNEGLIRQKNGMGGRGVAYNTYRIPLT